MGESKASSILGGLHGPQQIGNGRRAEQRRPVAAHVMVSDIEGSPFASSKRSRPVDEVCLYERTLVHRRATGTARVWRDVGCSGRTSFLVHVVLGQCGSHALSNIKRCKLPSTTLW